jgi:hypothetical protein
MRHLTTTSSPVAEHGSDGRRPVADAAYAGRTAGRRVARSHADARLRIRTRATW